MTGDTPPPDRPGRGQLLRDLIVFQGKLFLDGFRDLLLSPASLFLGLVDILSPRGGEPRFYRLLRLGHRSDRWINLFGAAGPPQPGDDDDDDEQTDNVDRVVEQLERSVRDRIATNARPGEADRSNETGGSKPPGG